jgi:hypothetical protein
MKTVFSYKIKYMKKVIFLMFAMLVISCNSKKDDIKKNEKDIVNKPKVSSLNFDKILKINEYIYMVFLIMVIFLQHLMIIG